MNNYISAEDAYSITSKKCISKWIPDLKQKYLKVYSEVLHDLCQKHEMDDYDNLLLYFEIMAFTTSLLKGLRISSSVKKTLFGWKQIDKIDLDEYSNKLKSCFEGDMKSKNLIKAREYVGTTFEPEIRFALSNEFPSIERLDINDKLIISLTDNDNYGLRKISRQISLPVDAKNYMYFDTIVATYIADEIFSTCLDITKQIK